MDILPANRVVPASNNIADALHIEDANLLDKLVDTMTQLHPYYASRSISLGLLLSAVGAKASVTSAVSKVPAHACNLITCVC